MKSAVKSPEMIEYLLGRRSTSLTLMGHQRPSDDEIKTILNAAMRVPDHGKMCPWYFIVVKDDARAKIGKLLREAYRKDQDPNATPAKIELESERFLRAPMAIIVVSRMREGKHSLWEQFMSAGASCFALSLAAHGLGYGVNWLSEWYSTSPTFKSNLGLDERDHIAGVMYIGNLKEQPEERERPRYSHLVTQWDGEGTPLNKGDEHYGKSGKGLPDAGIILPPSSEMSEK
jgi:nitroreductase